MHDENFQFSIDAHPLFDSDLDGPGSVMKGMLDVFAGRGKFRVEVWRQGVYSHDVEFKNGITVSGINYLLGCGFAGVTQLTSWFCFPINNVGYTALYPTDTMAVHASWVESINYSETTRPSWGAGTPTGGSITNATQMIMTINTDGTALVGLGICSIATKNTATGQLWAHGLFSAVQNMNSGDVLKITYITTLTPVS